MYMYFAAYRFEIKLKHNLFEFVFFIDIIVNCFRSYIDQSSLEVVDDWDKIVHNYLNTTFLIDMIPIIPLQLIKLENNANNIFLIIKTMRAFKSLGLLSVQKVMKLLLHHKSKITLAHVEKKRKLQDPEHLQNERPFD